MPILPLICLAIQFAPSLLRILARDTAGRNAEVETLRIEMADLANARAMGLDLVEAKHWTGNMPAIVALIIIAATRP